jgi:hypothetical protein
MTPKNTALTLCVTAALSLWSSAARCDNEACAKQSEQATELKESGKYEEALQLFERCAQDSCPKIVKQDCRKGLSEIRTQSPYLTVKVTDDAGIDVAGVIVRIDGNLVSVEALVAGVLVNAGDHKVEAVDDVRGTASQIVTVVRGERVRAVTLVLKSKIAPQPIDTKHIGSQGADLRTLKPLEPSRNRTPAIVVGSAGLGFAALGGVLNLTAYLDYTSLDKECAPRCGDRADGARTRATLGNVSLVLGASSLLVATVLWFTAPSKATNTSFWLPTQFSFD